MRGSAAGGQLRAQMAVAMGGGGRGGGGLPKEKRRTRAPLSSTQCLASPRGFTDWLRGGQMRLLGVPCDAARRR
jgi:hypothetical protein